MEACVCTHLHQATTYLLGRPALEIIAAENDSIFRSVQPEAIYQEQHEELDADYEYLGSGVIDALILSITSVLAHFLNAGYLSQHYSIEVLIFV